MSESEENVLQYVFSINNLHTENVDSLIDERKQVSSLGKTQVWISQKKQNHLRFSAISVQQRPNASNQIQIFL